MKKDMKKNIYMCVCVCVCVHMTETLCCAPETYISLQINYTSIFKI